MVGRAVPGVPKDLPTEPPKANVVGQLKMANLHCLAVKWLKHLQALF
jgi:hypothetical protein